MSAENRIRTWKLAGIFGLLCFAMSGFALDQSDAQSTAKPAHPVTHSSKTTASSASASHSSSSHSSVSHSSTSHASSSHSSRTAAAKSKSSGGAHAATKHASSHTSASAKSTSRAKKGSKTSSRASSKTSKTAKKRGQQAIDGDRARAIQEALIREHYLEGEPSGSWDAATQAAMRQYQADQGWQAKTTPDSRALIKLGLGPSHDHLLNPESAMTSSPAGDPKAPAKADPAENNIPQN
jgi:hypothetical protein